MSGKFALIIGNTEYTDPGLAQLTAPGKDAEDFARVLKSPDICGFDDVNILLNEPSFVVSEAIDAFFYQKKPDDLLIVYFSGHGVRDEYGALYLAVKNTNRIRLRATAIRSDYIREAMDQSRSKRQVVILDCCNSGAFPQGTKAEVGGTMGLVSALQGYGRFVLTASDATQFAWEGDQVIGTTQNSLFTHFLVKGLEGEADNDGDGRITVDELYDYAYDEISRLTPKQTPTKSISKQEGEILLRQITRIQDIKLVPLPDDLISEIDDIRPYVREAAVQKLERIVKGKNIGMARSAIQALEKIAVDDNTTRRVAQMATHVLEAVRQAEQTLEQERKERAEAEQPAILQASQEPFAREKTETVENAKIELEQEAIEQETARAKAEREVAEKTKRERAEQHVARQATLTKALSESFSTLKSTLPKATPFLKIAGLAGIIAVLFWIGSALGPQIMSFIPVADASPTFSPTATMAFTDSPLPPTKTVTPAVTGTKTPIPSPTKSPTSTATPTRVLVLLIIKNANAYWNGADFYVDGSLIAQNVAVGQTIQTSVYFGTHELCVRRRSNSIACNGQRTFEVNSDPYNLQWP